MERPILVVEDDATLTRAIVRNLEARGYATERAGSVADALAATQTTVPSLVVLDIDLPDGSGWDVLRYLRASDRKEVPVIVISALRPNARLVTELGCFAVLEKPFPMESLMRLVKSELDHA